MKKSNYVTKYDYLAYYTKQPAMWFFSNAELEASYKLQYETFSHHFHNDDTEDDEEQEDETLDSYDAFRSLNDKEESATEYKGDVLKFKEYLEQLRNVDDINPLIVEGRIIDQKSKEYIKKHFTEEENVLYSHFEIFDFDELYSKSKLEKQAVLTKEILDNNENVIIFQPVFIDVNRQIATKCDALVKVNKDIYIIETKATSTAKLHHFLDLFYQSKVLDTFFDKKKFQLHYLLCLVRYERLKRKEISFILTDRFNLTKSPSISSKNEFTMEQKQLKKLAQPFEKLNAKSEVVEDLGGPLFDEVFNYDYDEDIFSKAKGLEKKTLLDETMLDFDIVISKLWEHKRKLTEFDIPQPFIPSLQDKSTFKNTDMWLVLRKLYAAKGFLQFNYSGNVLDFSSRNLEKIGSENLINNDEIDSFLKGKEKLSSVYVANRNRYVLKTSPAFSVDEKATIEILKCLKKKKVYFDFESINPSIRAIDDSLPFTQAITQNSVIKDHGLGIKDQKCLNMVCDPNLIDTNWFKKIIDELYEGPDYSYVVYNKNFETNRLKEMANFINEEDYFKKVNCINQHIFDLADFFVVSSKKESVVIKELGGFYSIKKVLPLVEKYQPDIFRETGCKDYKTLNVSNGLMCQQKTTARFYDSLTDKEWEQLVSDVSVYCENDVRAMAAVEYLVTKFILPKYAPNCLEYLN